METPFSVDDVNRLIRSRRTIKPLTKAGAVNYLERPVDDAIIIDLLENANWAPTHGLTEPWRFQVFTGESRLPFAQFLSDSYAQNTSKQMFRAIKQEKMYRNVATSPCTISIGMKRHEGRIPAEEEVEAVACAVQNIHLTATAYGLGGFWSTSPIYDLAGTREYLGLGEADRCLGLFFVGYPAQPWPERPNGGPGNISEKTVWRR